MDDDELNMEIAKALGWVYEWHSESRPGKCAGTRALQHWHDETGIVKGFPPEFATSVDALAPVEERLRDAGWRLTSSTYGEEDGGGWYAEWWGPSYQTLLGEAPTEARARAEAALAALTHLQPITAELDTEQEQS